VAAKLDPYREERGRALCHNLRVLAETDEDSRDAGFQRGTERKYCAGALQRLAENSKQVYRRTARRADEEGEEHDGRGVVPICVVRRVRV
jgi:DICT domain-containing protein